MHLTTRAMTACALFALGQSSVYAETPPADCYEKTMQTVIETKVYETSSMSPGGGGGYAVKVPTQKEVSTLKKVHIKIVQTQETDTSPIKLDASGSTVPSGKIAFEWNGKTIPENTKAVYMVEDSSPGSYSTQKLRVRDLVCNTSELKEERVTSK